MSLLTHFLIIFSKWTHRLLWLISSGGGLQFAVLLLFISLLLFKIVMFEPKLSYQVKLNSSFPKKVRNPQNMFNLGII